MVRRPSQGMLRMLRMLRLCSGFAQALLTLGSG